MDLTRVADLECHRVIGKEIETEIETGTGAIGEIAPEAEVAIEMREDAEAEAGIEAGSEGAPRGGVRRVTMHASDFI